MSGNPKQLIHVSANSDSKDRTTFAVKKAIIDGKEQRTGHAVDVPIVRLYELLNVLSHYLTGSRLFNAFI